MSQLTCARLDIKCGNGAISKGEKCTKGPGVSAPPRTKKGRGLAGKLEAAGTLAGVASIALSVRSLNKNIASPGSSFNPSNAGRLASAGFSLIGASQLHRGERTGSAASKVIGSRALASGISLGVINERMAHRARKNSPEGQAKAAKSRTTSQNLRAGLSRLKGRITQRKQRASLEKLYLNSSGNDEIPPSQRRRKDSIWAEGFELNYK